jgi:hypothetical protein
MGAFETFVNANLGIRKPLISDAGPPSGSAKAAGIVGSHYIDTDTNYIYEKTGENNTTDWVRIRRLGESLNDAIDAQRTFSTSLSIPTGVDTLSFNYADIGDTTTYQTAPQVNVSMRLDEQSQFFYAYNTYNVSSTGFSVSLSDTMLETGNFLDISVHRD